MASLTESERNVLLSMCIIGLCPLQLSFLFFRRRHLTPIKERMPLTSLVGANGIVLASVIGLARTFAFQSCIQTYATFILFENVQLIEIIAYISRYFVHYIGYRLNRAKILTTIKTPLKMFDTNTNVIAVKILSPFDRWLLKNKWIISHKFLVPFWTIVLMISISYDIGFAISFNWDDTTCNTSAQELYLMPWYAFWCVILAALGSQLRKLVDGFHIKSELMLQLRMAIIIMIAFVIPPLNEFQKNVFPIISVLYWVSAQITFLATIVMPIYWSYKESYFDQDLNVSLDDILDQRDTLDAFKQFLASEFCIENLFFLLSVRNLKRVESQERKALELWLDDMESDFGRSRRGMTTSVKQIYDVFCVESSPFQINISSHTLGEIEQNLEQGDSSIFDGAVKEIRYLLQTNSLGRFLNSPLGRQCNRLKNRSGVSDGQSTTVCSKRPAGLIK